MAVQISANGRDQWSELQTKANSLVGTSDPTLIIRGEILRSRTFTVKEGVHVEPYDSTPGAHGLQSLNDSGPVYDQGALYLPRSLTLLGTDGHVEAYTFSDLHAKTHVNIVGDGVELNSIYVRGTKKTTGRSANIRDVVDGSNHRNYLEGQVGVNVSGASDVLVKDVDIEDVWGDFAGANPSGAGTSSVNCKRVVFDGGTWDNAGRHGFGCNGVSGDGTEGSGLTWRNTVVKRHSSSMFHIETATNVLAAQSDILLEDLEHVDGDFTVHIRQGNGLDRVVVRRVYDHSLLRVDIAPQTDTHHRMTYFTIDSCQWDGPSNEVFQTWAIDHLWLTNNVGHLEWNGALYDATAMASCTDTHISNPGVVRDARPL